MREEYSAICLIELNSKAVDLNLSGTCPHCLKKAVFEHIGPNDYINEYRSKFEFEYGYVYSTRRCPGCRGIVFLISIRRKESLFIEMLEIFPYVEPKMETEGLPPLVTQFLTEALKCFGAGCYRASAIMIRRTLEEICAEVGAEGKDLHHRILDLPNKTSVHQRFVDAMMQLKYLGNDAAHVELKTFDQIGRDEVDLGLELIQEIIRSWFKILHLEGKLKSLHKAP